MPDLQIVLAALIATFGVVAVIAVTLAYHSVEPASRLHAVVGSEVQAMRLAVRAAARRGGLALLTAVAALLGSTWVANTAFRNAIGDGVFAAPVLAAAVGVGLYGLLQSRPLIDRPASAASLEARRASGFARGRSFVAVAALVALLLALAVFATVATPGFATFSGPRMVGLIGVIGSLVAAVVFALRRIAERAALPTALGDVDRAIRQIATRFVLLLTISALLAPIALVALQSGIWLWSVAAIEPQSAGDDALLGWIITIVGALAAVVSVASSIAVVLATAKQWRSTTRVVTLPSAVTA